MGYNNYWQVLNAKHYGIPQNRERVFVVSILKSKDDGKFKFPIPFDNGLRLKDFLESNVDEKYYISEGKSQNLIMNFKKEYSFAEKRSNELINKLGYVPNMFNPYNKAEIS